MTLTRSTVLALFALAVCFSPLQAADKHQGPWLYDIDQAKAIAQKTGRPVMLLFTGSDWCPPCIAQEKEVFANKKWQEWAVANIVPVMVDSPRKKALDSKQKAHNDKLKKEFPSNGVPTIVMLKPDGTEFERWVGYGASIGGVSGWIKRAEAAFAKVKSSSASQ
jgi:thioredoxin-related protein